MTRLADLIPRKRSARLRGWNLFDCIGRCANHDTFAPDEDGGTIHADNLSSLLRQIENVERDYYTERGWMIIGPGENNCYLISDWHVTPAGTSVEYIVNAPDNVVQTHHTLHELLEALGKKTEVTT